MKPERKQITSISPQPNYWLTVSSLSVVLLLGAIPFFMAIEVPQIVSYVQDNSHIGVSFQEDINEKQKDSLRRVLTAYEQVAEELDWVSASEAWDMVSSDFEGLGENPVSDMLLIKLKSGWDDLHFQHELAQSIQAFSFVDDVYVPPVRFDQVRSNIRYLTLFLGVLAVFALFGAALLIYYTIRLSIYDKRFAIRTLELVGAEWSFIQRPFVKRGLKIGLLSAIFASVVLALLVVFWGQTSPHVNEYLDWTGLIWSVTTICILGPFIGMLTSMVTVSKYLQGGLRELFDT